MTCAHLSFLPVAYEGQIKVVRSPSRQRRPDLGVAIIPSGPYSYRLSNRSRTGGQGSSLRSSTFSRYQPSRHRDSAHSIKTEDSQLILFFFVIIRAVAHLSFTPSISSNSAFVLRPPKAEKPPSRPLAARTRWHGTMSGNGLCASALPTARAAPGDPDEAAI